MQASEAPTLYKQLGGYDAIAAVANHLGSRLQGDERLWAVLGTPGGRRRPA